MWNIIKNSYMLQFQCRPPRFNGVVTLTVLAHSASVLGQEVLKLLLKCAIEVVQPNERN